MPILARLREFLEANQVEYSVHSHPQAYTAQEVAALSHVKGHALAKVVMVRAGERLVMLVLGADQRVDFARLRAALGPGEARLATEAEFGDLFPGCETGAMPPFGNLWGVPVYADRSLESNEHLVFNAGTHTLTAKLAFRDFARLVTPTMADFAVPHR
jgi:Ala-tRNA(Pro) deacylase